MSLVRLADVETELADGSRVILDAYLGDATFDGQRKRVIVTVTPGSDSLLGTWAPAREAGAHRLPRGIRSGVERLTR